MYALLFFLVYVLFVCTILKATKNQIIKTQKEEEEVDGKMVTIFVRVCHVTKLPSKKEVEREYVCKEKTSHIPKKIEE